MQSARIYNIIVTECEPSNLKKYLSGCEIVYDKQTMNVKCQVGSGCIITFTHDTPFIVQEDNTTSESKSQEVSDKKIGLRPRYISRSEDIGDERA